jgi:hypothetical protein
VRPEAAEGHSRSDSNPSCAHRRFDATDGCAAHADEGAGGNGAGEEEGCEGEFHDEYFDLAHYKDKLGSLQSRAINSAFAALAALTVALEAEEPSKLR